jgi:hypothetical protein
MKGIDLLNKYTTSAEIIREWFLEKMIESLQTTDVPDDFKNMMKQTGIENDKLAIMIDSNPRMLFDVFDENDIYINIEAYLGELTLFDSFGYGILGQKLLIANMEYKTRKEAELVAIEAAFEILESNLGEKRMNIIGQNGNTGEHYDEVIE